MRTTAFAAILAPTLASGAHAAAGDRATAQMKDKDGKALGTRTQRATRATASSAGLSAPLNSTPS